MDDFERKLEEAAAKIGMVYVVRDDAMGRVKIGTSLNPLQRLRDLQTGSSSPLRLLALFPGGRWAEQQFHKNHADRRLDGEWFEDGDGYVSDLLIEVAEMDVNSIAWPQR